MQIETWWLFALPIVFALGWIGARWDMRLEKRESEIERLAQQKSTFKGLNLLLNEEPDKAIDALVQIASKTKNKNRTKRMTIRTALLAVCITPVIL